MPRSDAATKGGGRELVLRPEVRQLAEPALAPLVARFAREVTFAPGEVIYRAGEDPHCFYTFARGQVELSTDGIRPWVLDSQSGIGLLDVLADRPRTSTATAVTRVRAMQVSADHYFDLLEEHFELVMAAVLDIADHVHEIGLWLAPDGGFAQVAGEGRAPRAPLSRPADLVQKIHVLRSCSLFERANVQALVRLSALVREVRVAEGDTLFRRGEASGKFFLVAEGSVEASREDPEIVARFGRGDLVCGHGALGTADSLYSAIARSPAVAFSFSEEDFFDVMEEHFALVRSVLAGMAAEYERLLLDHERRLRGPAP